MPNPKLASILSLACLGATANATLIDSFLPVDHALDRSLLGNDLGPSSYVESFAGYGIGGERDLEFQLQDPYRTRAIARYERVSGENFEALRVGALGPGIPLPGARFEVSFQYDGTSDETGNQGLGKRLNNGGTGIPFLSGTEGGFRIWYWDRFSQVGIASSMVLRRQGTVIGEVNTDIGFGGGSGLLHRSFVFTPEQLAAADSITLILYGETGGNLAPTVYLSHLDTILPEPGTYAIFGGGLAYLGWRRRRAATKIK